MSSWFQRQRQDFIRAQLEAFGQIRRADIADRFEVSVQVASADIAEFMAVHPDAIIYDGRAKCYVFDDRALQSSASASVGEG
jgi:hypothetical protein